MNETRYYRVREEAMGGVNGTLIELTGEFTAELDEDEGVTESGVSVYRGEVDGHDVCFLCHELALYHCYGVYGSLAEDGLGRYGVDRVPAEELKPDDTVVVPLRGNDPCDAEEHGTRRVDGGVDYEMPGLAGGSETFTMTAPVRASS